MRSNQKIKDKLSLVQQRRSQENCALMRVKSEDYQLDLLENQSIRVTLMIDHTFQRLRMQ